MTATIRRTFMPSRRKRMNEDTAASLDLQATLTTRNRYQRMAPLYDGMQAMMERRYARWRERQ